MSGEHIPARALAIIDRHCAEGGYTRERFLSNLTPMPAAMRQRRWACWRELVEERRAFDGHRLYSKLRVARWFGVDPTSVVNATNPATRLRKALRWWKPKRETAA